MLISAAWGQAAWCETPSARVDVVGSTGFVQLEANSFRSLTPRQQALAYWLSEASIAINPIIYDQTLAIRTAPEARAGADCGASRRGVDRDGYAKILAFTKLFWANRGNHNETTAQKFLPEFTFEELHARASALRHGDRGSRPSRRKSRI